MEIDLNDAWEDIPLEFADDCIEYLKTRLQATHPLKNRKIFPAAKRWRKDKYLIEDDEDTSVLWVLDMGRRKRIDGKTCYYFKQIENQQELDELLKADYDDWVLEMKRMGAWNEG